MSCRFHLGTAWQGHLLRRHAFHPGRLLVRHLPHSAIGFHRAKLCIEPRRRAGAGCCSRAFWPAQSSIHSLRHVQSSGPFLSGRREEPMWAATFWDGRTPDTATQARMPFWIRTKWPMRQPAPFRRTPAAIRRSLPKSCDIGLTRGCLKMFLAAMFSKPPPTKKSMI